MRTLKMALAGVPRPRLAMALLAGVVMICGLGNSAHAGPLAGGFLSNWSADALTIIVDGTSNTLLLNENTVIESCFDNVVLRDIVDGTSNTIIGGEVTYESACRPNLRDLSNWEQVLRDIADGSSNTIFIGETDGFAILDRSSRVRICASNGLTSIVDGTSNTIAVGESLCFDGLQIGVRQQASVAAPGTLALLMGALLILGISRHAHTGNRSAPRQGATGRARQSPLRQGCYEPR